LRVKKVRGKIKNIFKKISKSNRKPTAKTKSGPDLVSLCTHARNAFAEYASGKLAKSCCKKPFYITTLGTGHNLAGGVGRWKQWGGGGHIFFSQEKGGFIKY
jgi:hypothetical protein